MKTRHVPEKSQKSDDPSTFYKNGIDPGMKEVGVTRFDLFIQRILKLLRH